MKKIITILIVFIFIAICITPTIYAADTVNLNIPASDNDSNTAVNELMQGESTIHSSEEDSSANSEVVGLGTTDSQEPTAAGAVASVGGLMPSLINQLLAAVAQNTIPVLDDNAQVTDYFTIQSLLTDKYAIFNINLFKETPSAPNSDVSNVIKANVAVWYVAIRNLAAAGCTIIVIYVGIRMAIAATAQDMAKYKKMLTSWLISVVLLFVMHFIILIMIGISELFVKFISIAIESDTGTTNMEIAMLQGLYSKTNQADGWGKLVYFLLNCVLTYYETKFFLLYLFRVYKIMILTIISPLMCITYPIDSIGDGRAQAFNTWFKKTMTEIFIQPIHLLMYVVFIYSAGAIAAEQPIIGIFFIIALDNAESIIKSALKIQGKGLRDFKLSKGK